VEQVVRFPCKYCEKGHPGDAGGSYDRQACEARWCGERIHEIERRLREGVPPDDEEPLRRELQRLRRQEESARYVGD